MRIFIHPFLISPFTHTRTHIYRGFFNAGCSSDLIGFKCLVLRTLNPGVLLPWAEIQTALSTEAQTGGPRKLNL